MDSPEQWLADADVDPATLRPLVDLGKGRIAYLVSVPVKDAVEAWERLRRFTARSGYFPCVLGQDDFGDEPEFDAQTPAGADADLAQAALLDVDQWLAERRADQEAEAEEAEISLPTRDNTGDWDAKIAKKRAAQFAFPKELAKLGKTAALALVPSRSGYDVPAMLGFGGFNDCPEPAEQSAVLKRWQERYGAQPVFLHVDTLELKITRPPADRDEAMNLAWEQYLYCTDLLETHGTVAELAAHLMGAERWHFWWD